MSTNSGKIHNLMNGFGGLMEASTAQTGGQRVMGMAKTIGAILSMMA